MFTRLYWLTVGAVLGFAGAVWGLLRVKQLAARFTPSGVQSDVVGAVRRLGADLRAAATEGRTGMREAEQRIRSDLRGASVHELTGARGPRR